MKKYIVVLALLLFFGGLSFFIYGYKTGGCIAQVYSHGELIKEIDLSKVEEGYEFVVKNGNEKNVVRVEPGKIGVVEASCPDKVCINTGFISDGVVPVVCLPNELVIKIKGNKGGADGKAG